MKCNHLLKTVLLRLEVVQKTAEEDKKHVSLYTGYMALETETASGDLKEN